MRGQPRPPLRRTAAELAGHARVGALAAAATVVDVLVSTAGPLIMASGLAAVVARNAHRVVITAVALTFVTAGQLGATYVAQLSATRFAQHYLGDLRTRLLEHLFALDLDFFRRERAGRVVARL